MAEGTRMGGATNDLCSHRARRDGDGVMSQPMHAQLHKYRRICNWKVRKWSNGKLGWHTGLDWNLTGRLYLSVCLQFQSFRICSSWLRPYCLARRRITIIQLFYIFWKKIIQPSTYVSIYFLK
jgi:hypothetical protein